MPHHLSNLAKTAKRVGIGAVVAVLAAVLVSGVALAQTFPQPTGNLVSDFAGLLSQSAKSQLEARLLQLEKDTTDEVAVVTVSSLEGDTIEDYASGLFKEWGIGKKDKDNGVLFLIALQERKVRIEVGYGLEPILTDGRAGRILDSQVLPSFRQGDYEKGIVAGVAAIEDYLRTDVPPAPIEDNLVQKLFKSDSLGLALIVLGIASIYVFGFAARSTNVWLGGIWGAAMGVFFGLATGRVVGLILVFLGMTGFGLFLDWLLSRNYKILKSMGRSTGWGSSYGGFYGGGGYGGGGGGFHFGGGGSGGGGASRGW